MTKEQWLVYLWGIYPEGGWTFLWIIGLFFWGFFLLIIFLNYNELAYGGNDNKLLWIKIKTKYKIGVTLLFIFLLFLSSLVPDKKVALAIIGTPYIVEGLNESIESDKLNKLNTLIDLSLDKAINKLKEKEE